eukprot:XP_016658064.1 PREDICTED: uncharacterized protein LOC107883111 [Acyrthosiphon pisum]
MDTSIPRSSNNVISSSVYQTTPKNQTANLNVDSNHETSSIFQTTPKNQTANLNLDSIHETSSIFQTTPKNQTANLNLDSIHETSSINHTTHRSLPINILSNLSDSTLASPLPSTSRDLSSSFIINGIQNTPTTDLLQQIFEQGNATHIFLKRLDGKIERLEHKIMDISTNKNNNNIQTLNDDFLSYFPMKDIAGIDNIEALITNDIGFKKNVENFVTQIGGTDAKNFVKRIFQRLFSNELSSKCSWTGFRNNFKLENLTIVAIIKGVCRDNFKISDIEFETLVKHWFRHGAQRLARDQLLCKNK